MVEVNGCACPHGKEVMDLRRKQFSLKKLTLPGYLPDRVSITSKKVVSPIYLIVLSIDCGLQTVSDPVLRSHPLWGAQSGLPAGVLREDRRNPFM